MSSPKYLGEHYTTGEPLLAGAEMSNESMADNHSEEPRYSCQGVEKGLVHFEQRHPVVRSVHHSEVLLAMQIGC